MHFSFYLWILVSISSSNGQEPSADDEMDSEDAIEMLRIAKQRAEEAELENSFVARLAEDMFRGSEVCLQGKMDMDFDNHSASAKGLNFWQGKYNCGNDFNIFKLLEEVRGKKLSTEPPKCIEALLGGEDGSCADSTTPRQNGSPSSRERVSKGTARSRLSTKETQRKPPKETSQLSTPRMGANANPKVKPVGATQSLSSPQPNKAKCSEEYSQKLQAISNLQPAKANKQSIAQQSNARKALETMSSKSDRGTASKHPTSLEELKSDLKFANASASKGSNEPLAGKVISEPKSKTFPIESIPSKNKNTKINENFQDESQIGKKPEDNFPQFDYFYENKIK